MNEIYSVWVYDDYTVGLRLMFGQYKKPSVCFYVMGYSSIFANVGLISPFITHLHKRVLLRARLTAMIREGKGDEVKEILRETFESWADKVYAIS